MNPDGREEETFSDMREAEKRGCGVAMVRRGYAGWVGAGWMWNGKGDCYCQLVRK